MSFFLYFLKDPYFLWFMWFYLYVSFVIYVMLCFFRLIYINVTNPKKIFTILCNKKLKSKKPVKYFHNFSDLSFSIEDDLSLFFFLLLFALFIFSSKFLHLLLQIFFLLLLNDLLFCLNLLFHLHDFQQDSMTLLHLPHIREYQSRLNIILSTWSNDCLPISIWLFTCSTQSFKFETFFLLFKINYMILLV